MKKNNKGFMLLETLIVSTVILSTLIFLFVQFSNIKSSYEISFTHNTIPGIYIARELSDLLIETGDSIVLSNELDNSQNGYINITSSILSINKDFYEEMMTHMNIKDIIYTDNNLTTLKTHLNSENIDKNIFTESFKNFIFKLKNKETNKKMGRLIIKFNDNTFASIVIGGVQ